MATSETSPTAQLEGLTIQDWCSLGSLIETKVYHEINLIGFRMAALLISESFLFGIFAVILNPPDSSTPHTAVKKLVVLIPIVGILLVLSVWPSLLAANRVMRALSEARSDVEEGLRRLTRHAIPHLPNLGLETTRDKSLKGTVKLGAFPMYAVPFLLLGTWFFLFLLVALHYQPK